MSALNRQSDAGLIDDIKKSSWNLSGSEKGKATVICSRLHDTTPRYVTTQSTGSNLKSRSSKR